MAYFFLSLFESVHGNTVKMKAMFLGERKDVVEFPTSPSSLPFIFVFRILWDLLSMIADRHNFGFA